MVTSLTIFLPAYNEAENLPKLVTDIEQFAQKNLNNFELIIVNDGSTDQTLQVSNKLAQKYSNLSVISHPTNLGYGAAIKSALAAAKHPWVFFMDSDGQFDINELADFLKYDHEDLVIGFRIVRDDPPRRILASKVYGSIVKALYGFKVRDIDCAFKLMRKEKVRSLALQSDSFFISTELLVKASKAKLPLREIGVHHYPRHKGVSTVTLQRVFESLRELAKLYFNLKLQKH